MRKIPFKTNNYNKMKKRRDFHRNITTGVSGLTSTVAVTDRSPRSNFRFLIFLLIVSGSIIYPSCKTPDDGTAASLPLLEPDRFSPSRMSIHTVPPLLNFPTATCWQAGFRAVGSDGQMMCGSWGRGRKRVLTNGENHSSSPIRKASLTVTRYFFWMEMTGYG
jgi:hypothetical protein